MLAWCEDYGMNWHAPCRGMTRGMKATRQAGYTEPLQEDVHAPYVPRATSRGRLTKLPIRSDPQKRA
jgi:hypothetical protein